MAARRNIAQGLQGQGDVPTVAIAWELGGYLAHINRCGTLANVAIEQGMRPVILSRDVTRTWALPALQGIDVFQAPVWQRRARRLRRSPESLSEILLLHGYRRPEELGALVDAWIRLLRTLEADFVLADYAPTAMLAAAVAGIPATTFGQPFSMPPESTPLSAMAHVRGPDRERLERVERFLLSTVKRVLGQRGHAGFNDILPLFRTPGDAICGIPELDCYERERAAGDRFIGALHGGEGGRKVDFRSDNRPRAFAYLKAEAEQTRVVLDALVAAECEAWVYCAGAGPQLADRVAGSRVYLSDAVLDIPHVATQCDFGICHGGHDTLCNLLCLGVPVLVAPMQVEQQQNAACMERIGAGRTVGRTDTVDQVTESILAIVGDPSFRQSSAKVGAPCRDRTPRDRAFDFIAGMVQRSGSRAGADDAKPLQAEMGK